MRSGTRRFIAIALFALAGLALSAVSRAAEIHGTVSEEGKPLPAGVALKVECGGTSASAQTDRFGSYSLKIAATGECRLSLDYKGSTASLPVTLYDRPSRYDLVVKHESGKLTLARR
jgi:hypothetical protein